MYTNNIIEFPKIKLYVVSQYIYRRSLICTIIGYIKRIWWKTRKIKLIDFTIITNNQKRGKLSTGEKLKINMFSTVSPRLIPKACSSSYVLIHSSTYCQILYKGTGTSVWLSRIFYKAYSLVYWMLSYRFIILSETDIFVDIILRTSLI